MFSRTKFHTKWQAGETQIKANCTRVADGVYFHQTKIVDWSTGIVRLFTDGWRTAGTKAHINEVLKALGHYHTHVFQKQGEWFVKTNNQVIPFTKGMYV